MSVKKRSTGDKLRGIPTRDWNKFVDTANFVDTLRGPAANPTNGEANGTIVLVKNATRYDRNRFDVLGIDSPIITPTANLGEFKNRVMLSCSTPRTGSTTNTSIPDHTGKFVILQEPIPIGGIGKAIVAGVTIARVKVETDTLEATTAGVDDNDPEQLLAGGSGAEILWKESGKGYKWAVVRMGGSITSLPVQWFTPDLKNTSLSANVFDYPDGGSLSFDEVLGTPVDITHDMEESDPFTNGNFTVVNAGLFRFEVYASVQRSGVWLPDPLMTQILTTSTDDGHSHTVESRRLASNNGWASFLWHKKSVGASSFDPVSNSNLVIGIFDFMDFEEQFASGSISFLANLAAGDVLRMLASYASHSGVGNGAKIGDCQLMVTKVGAYIED